MKEESSTSAAVGGWNAPSRLQRARDEHHDVTARDATQVDRLLECHVAGSRIVGEERLLEWLLEPELVDGDALHLSERIRQGGVSRDDLESLVDAAAQRDLLQGFTALRVPRRIAEKGGVAAGEQPAPHA